MNLKNARASSKSFTFWSFFMQYVTNYNESDVELWTKTAQALNGSARRVFMARVVTKLGRGGSSFAEKNLNWNRNTINKGLKELANGAFIDRRKSKSGRKPSEYYLPNLLVDIKKVVEPFTQTEPTFKSLKKYTRITAKSVLKTLSTSFDYAEAHLPCLRTINNKLRDLKFLPAKVKKTKPLKKIPEVDAIFNTIKEINAEAAIDKDALYISVDTKAAIKVGDFSRGGYSRVIEKANDHDFATKPNITPFGALLPNSGKSYLWFTEGPVTADFMVDCIEDLIKKELEIKPFNRVVINADNGPENNSHRTQWMKRLLEINQKMNLKIQLAYYPPYHSKYNPVERLWGVLENEWSGQLLNSIEKIMQLASSMTFRQIEPIVSFIEKKYEKGVKLTKTEMEKIECMLARKQNLEKWFIQIG